MKDLLFDIACLEPLLDEFLTGNRANGLEQIVVTDVVECALDIGVSGPTSFACWVGLVHRFSRWRHDSSVLVAHP